MTQQTDVEAFEEAQRARTLRHANQDEELALSAAVKAALMALKEITGDEYTTEERIDASSRVLGYASTFHPDIVNNITTTNFGDEDVDTGEGDGNEEEYGGADDE